MALPPGVQRAMRSISFHRRKERQHHAKVRKSTAELQRLCARFGINFKEVRHGTAGTESKAQHSQTDD